MQQQPVFITLGIIQVIFLSLFGLYFYRLAHKPSQAIPQAQTAVDSEAPLQAEAPAQRGQASACRRGGCSGQICGDKVDSAVTTCEFRPEYACYQEARCERQADGLCGFTETDALKQCLEKAKGALLEKKYPQQEGNLFPL